MALAQLVSQGGAIDKASPQSNSNSSNKEDDDEFAMYAGRTRFISSTTRSRSPTRSPSSQGMGVSGPGGGRVSSRRRGSESLGPSNIRIRENSNRRGSEPYPYGDIPPSESEVFRQAHPTLLEHLRGISGYVPPPAIMQGMIAAREEQAAREASSMSGGGRPPPHPIVKSEAPYSWAEPNTTVSPPMIPPSSSPNSVYIPPSAQYDTPINNGGIYVPDAQPNPAGIMAQAVGTFGYSAELNGDGTWQQLMVQLGVLEGSN